MSSRNASLAPLEGWSAVDVVNGTRHKNRHTRKDRPDVSRRIKRAGTARTGLTFRVNSAMVAGDNSESDNDTITSVAFDDVLGNKDDLRGG
jgi:hypothetical protein